MYIGKKGSNENVKKTDNPQSVGQNDTGKTPYEKVVFNETEDYAFTRTYSDPNCGKDTHMVAEAFSENREYDKTACYGPSAGVRVAYDQMFVFVREYAHKNKTFEGACDIIKPKFKEFLKEEYLKDVEYVSKERWGEDTEWLYYHNVNPDDYDVSDFECNDGDLGIVYSFPSYAWAERYKHEVQPDPIFTELPHERRELLNCTSLRVDKDFFSGAVEPATNETNEFDYIYEYDTDYLLSLIKEKGDLETEIDLYDGHNDGGFIIKRFYSLLIPKLVYGPFRYEQGWTNTFHSGWDTDDGLPNLFGTEYEMNNCEADYKDSGTFLTDCIDRANKSMNGYVNKQERIDMISYDPDFGMQKPWTFGVFNSYSLKTPNYEQFICADSISPENWDEVFCIGNERPDDWLCSSTYGRFDHDPQRKPYERKLEEFAD